MNIYVGNLPYTLTEDELVDTFDQFGEVVSAKLIKDKNTGKPKGFGFVQMEDHAAAKEAIHALNDSALNGRNIKVNKAHPKGK